MTGRRPALYLMHGFIGAGKTTFARTLSEKTGAVRLNADEYVAAHFSPAQQSDDWNACFAAAIDALWHEAAQRTANGEDVILDFGFWTRASRDDARGRAAAMGAECLHYYIDTPEHVILARMQAREGEIARRNVKNFQDLRKMFEPPAADEAAVCIRPLGPRP